MIGSRSNALPNQSPRGVDVDGAREHHDRDGRRPGGDLRHGLIAAEPVENVLPVALVVKRRPRDELGMVDGGW